MTNSQKIVSPKTLVRNVDIKAAKIIVRRHYGLNRSPTIVECQAEIDSLTRKHINGTKDDVNDMPLWSAFNRVGLI